MLTAEQLRERVAYNPETGSFIRKVGGKGCRLGDVAGCVHGQGYVVLSVCGKTYSAHRLAWLYVYGQWPTFGLDHINGNRADNRIENLRDVPPAFNAQNRRLAQGASPLLGVTFNKQAGKWQAQIKVGGSSKYLGLHATAEEAHAAYVAAKRDFHPGGML